MMRDQRNKRAAPTPSDEPAWKLFVLDVPEAGKDQAAILVHAWEGRIVHLAVSDDDAERVRLSAEAPAGFFAALLTLPSTRSARLLAEFEWAQPGTDQHRKRRKELFALVESAMAEGT